MDEVGHPTDDGISDGIARTHSFASGVSHDAHVEVSGRIVHESSAAGLEKHTNGFDDSANQERQEEQLQVPPPVSAVAGAGGSVQYSGGQQEREKVGATIGATQEDK